MNAPILKSTRRWTLVTALVAAGVMRTVFRETLGTEFVLSFLGSALWAVLSFWVVEGLVRHALVPPGTPRATGTIVRLVAAKVVLYALALWVLLSGHASPMGCILGFSLLLIVLVVSAIVGKPTLRIGPPAE